jgi:hypothetical protein
VNNVDEFLNSSEWKLLSRKIRLRDKRCLRCGSKYRLQTDHIIPRAVKSDLELEEWNLQTLCKNCNYEKSYIYIVSFLKNPNNELLTEIENLKDKKKKRLMGIAREQLMKSSKYSESRIISNELFKDIEKKIEKHILGIDNQETEGIFHWPLNILRFFGIVGVTLPNLLWSMTAWVDYKIACSRISESDVDDFVNSAVDKIFSDW